jgi:acyl carrier protein
MIDLNELRQSVADVLGCDVAEVVAGVRLDAIEGWDSMNALRLLTSLESDFGIRLDLREYARTESFDALLALVNSEAVKCAAK